MRVSLSSLKLCLWAATPGCACRQLTGQAGGLPEVSLPSWMQRKNTTGDAISERLPQRCGSLPSSLRPKANVWRFLQLKKAGRHGPMKARPTLAGKQQGRVGAGLATCESPVARGDQSFSPNALSPRLRPSLFSYRSQGVPELVKEEGVS